MDFLQLKYFLVVAKHQHISRAGQELFVSQPALSKMIKSLEKELGCELFDRVGKNIRLNERGEIVKKYAENIFSQVKNMKNELTDSQNVEGGEVRLSIIASTALLPDIVKKFREKYPLIDIKITQQEYKKGATDSDLYIYSVTDLKGENDSIKLLSESCSLAVCSTNPLAQIKQPVRVEDISQFKNSSFFVMENRKPLYDITFDLCRQGGFTPHIALECDSRSTIFSLIEADMGVAVVPDITWQKSMKSVDVRLLKINSPTFRHIVLKMGDGYQSNCATKLRDFIVDYYKKISQMFNSGNQ